MTSPVCLQVLAVLYVNGTTIIFIKLFWGFSEPMHVNHISTAFSMKKHPIHISLHYHYHYYSFFSVSHRELSQSENPLSWMCVLWWFKWEWPHRFMGLNIWSIVYKTVWKGLGGMSLLERLCRFQVSKPTIFQVSSLIHACGCGCKLSYCSSVMPYLPSAHQNGHEL